MDEELKKALEALNKQFEDFKTKQAENIGKKVDKDAVDTISKQIEALTSKIEGMEKEKVSEVLGGIKKQIEEMASDVANLKDNGKNTAKKHMSIGQSVVAKIKELGLDKKKWGKNDHETFEVETDVRKVAGTMTTANVDAVGTNSIPYELADFEAGLTRVQRRSPWILQIANVFPISTMYAQWAEQTNPDGTAGETGEGSSKNPIDFDWQEKSQKVEKLTAYVKVSKEALSDLPALQNEIDAELRQTVLLSVDAALLAGDGTTPSLNGILNQDTAYSAGAFAGTIDVPNVYDVLRTAIAQVVAAEFMPNYILLHPTDVAKMDLAKGEDGHYVLPPFKSADGLVISGVRVLENTGQTVDKFTVGDFTKFNVRVREGMTVDIGLDGNDFTNNLVTILGEVRLVSYIKANHAGAFVSGDFSDAITALATS